MENNKKTSLDEILAEHLGADFDAEKLKSLKSNLNSFIGQNTVPKATFNNKNSKLKDLKQKLAERAEKQKDANVWKAEMDKLKQDYENKLLEKDNAINDIRLTQALKDSKAKNPRAVKALLDLSKITFETDKIGGLEEQLEELKNGGDAFLFEIPANTVQKGTGFPSNPETKTQEVKTPINKVI